jgi:hypothetical protein
VISKKERMSRKEHSASVEANGHAFFPVSSFPFVYVAALGVLAYILGRWGGIIMGSSSKGLGLSSRFLLFLWAFVKDV